MKNNYVPQPIDTSEIKLSKELEELVEQMAKMFTKYGRKAALTRVGVMANNAMTSKRHTPF